MNELDSMDSSTPSAVSADDRNLAMLAHLLGIFFWFIPSLVIWLTNKDEAGKAFVSNQAKEALNFQITVFIASVVCGMLTFVVIGALLLPLVFIADIVLCIVAAIKAKKGVNYRYPFTLRLLS